MVHRFAETSGIVSPSSVSVIVNVTEPQSQPEMDGPVSLKGSILCYFSLFNVSYSIRYDTTVQDSFLGNISFSLTIFNMREKEIFQVFKNITSRFSLQIRQYILSHISDNLAMR